VLCLKLAFLRGGKKNSIGSKHAFAGSRTPFHNTSDLEAAPEYDCEVRTVRYESLLSLFCTFF
jgi:hypothetical protein